MKTMALLCLVFALSLPAAEEADEVFQKGLEALKSSESDQNAVVEAAKLLTKAANMYEKQGDDAKLVEVNSFLYWCKKKLTLKGAEEFKKTGTDVIAKLDKVAEKAPVTEAQSYYDRAETFAKLKVNDHMLIAIRFFEVADRFKGTDVSLQAQDRSLKEQQLAIESLKIAGAKVVVVAPAAKPKIAKWGPEAMVGTYKSGTARLGTFVIGLENGKLTLYEDMASKTTKNSIFLDQNTVLFEWGYEGRPQTIIGIFTPEGAQLTAYWGDSKGKRPSGQPEFKTDLMKKE